MDTMLPILLTVAMLGATGHAGARAATAEFDLPPASARVFHTATGAAACTAVPDSMPWQAQRLAAASDVALALSALDFPAVSDPGTTDVANPQPARGHRDAAAESSAPPRWMLPIQKLPEPGGWTTLVCGALVASFIVRRKWRVIED